MNKETNENLQNLISTINVESLDKPIIKSKVYSMINNYIYHIQRNEWLNFKEIRKDLLRYKHVSNPESGSNCYIYYWIGKIILSKSFDIYSDYIQLETQTYTETELEYFTDKMKFQNYLNHMLNIH